jgi:hypothetical protein
MRIGISVLGSKRLSRTAEAVRSSLAELGNDAVLVSDLPYSLSAYDFLIFMTEAKGMFGGLLDAVPQMLAKEEGLMGKRCLAMLRKGGLRSGYTLRKFMEVLEHEGLLVVEGEIFPDVKAAVQIAQGAPLRRK